MQVVFEQLTRKLLWTGILITGIAVASAENLPKPVMEFKFDKLENGKYKDWSGNGNDANPRFTEQCPGVDKKGVYFDANGKNLTAPVPAPFQKEFKDITISLWIAPDKISYDKGILGTGNFYKDYSFCLAMNYNRLDFRYSWLENGKQKTSMARSRESVIPEITMPKRTFYHFAAVYNGRQAVIYVNGKEVATSKASGKDILLQAAKRPLMFGNCYNQPWTSLNGAIDEVKIFDKALSASQVQVLYAEKQTFKPAPLEKKVAGTVNGQKYIPVQVWPTKGMPWVYRYATKTGDQLTVSNIGTILYYPRHYSDLFNFGIYDQTQRGAKFWKNVDGSYVQKISPDGSSEAKIIFKGLTHNDVQLTETISIDKEGKITFRYESEAEKNNIPAPYIPLRFNLSSARAIRFLGYTASGPICGSMPDLDHAVDFTHAAEWTFLDSRIRMELDKGSVYEMIGDRSPKKWVGGWSGFFGRIFKPEVKKWKQGDKCVIEFSLQNLDSSKSIPLLDRSVAKSVTEGKPFDFSPIYKSQDEKISVLPVDRQAPVFDAGESIALQVILPKGENVKSIDWEMTDAFTNKVISKNKLDGLAPDWWNHYPQIIAKGLPGGVYNIKVTAYNQASEKLCESLSEIAVAGEIEQPVLKPGEPLKLKLVDEIDCTKANKDHEYFSYSNDAKVIDINGVKYRETVTFDESQIKGIRHDWFGYQFKLKNPDKIHVIEVEYPNRDCMNMAISILEPKSPKGDGNQQAVNRGLSGLWTGGGYKADNKLLTTQIVYFPSASWCAVTFENLHDRFMPKAAGATISKVKIYEVEGELPKLGIDDKNQRMSGVFAEGGTLALGTFGYDQIRGSLAVAKDKNTFYRDNYLAVRNFIKYLRYRGDNMYIYGAVRYRGTEFPSRYIPPKGCATKGDLVALMGKMFEHNGLKLLLGIEANALMNVVRLPGFNVTPKEIKEGKEHLRQVDCYGDIPKGSYSQDGNPFHPTVQREYSRIAEEIAERYKDFPAIAGIAWFTGNEGITCPTINTANWKDRKDAVYPKQLIATYDDFTMAKFQKYLDKKIPVDAKDPERFRKRFDWIMQNAMEKWIQFRCEQFAALYRSFKNEMHKIAPQMEFFLMDDPVGALGGPYSFTGKAPLDKLRIYNIDPRLYKNEEKFVYNLLMPDPWNWRDRGRLRHLKDDEWLKVCETWENDPTLWKSLSGSNSGIFLHRQFEEKGLHLPHDRDWLFGKNPTRNLAQCYYPQPGGRANLKQFAHIMANSTPKMITWMWCDDSIPIGHEDTMREFCYAFRQIPMGTYKTIKRPNGIVVRMQTGVPEDKSSFYAVNTSDVAQKTQLKVKAGSVFEDIMSGKKVTAKADGTIDISVEPYQTRPFVRTTK
jgi:hypothetical protein